MRILGKHIGIVVFLVLVSLFTAVPSTTADIISTKLRSDNRPVIKLSEFNVTTKDYLSAGAGLTYMPYRYFFVFSLIYLCFSVLWIWFKNERGWHTMHTVMVVLLVMTWAHLLDASAERHYYVKFMHTPDHGWDALFYLLQFIRKEFFFTVIVLIGSGWCFWKPGLQGMDMLIMMALIVLQFFGYLASITMAVSTTGQYTDELKAVIFRADYACCVFMFVPMVCSILSLRDEVRETEGNNAAAAARNLEKVWLFVKVAVLYVFFTRIVIVIGLAPLIADKCPWVIEAVKETAKLVFCMVMFYMYRPVEENVSVGDIENLGL